MCVFLCMHVCVLHECVYVCGLLTASVVAACACAFMFVQQMLYEYVYASL